ncbi:hypothetical protein BJY01DRAFT_77649 [Aspergillus pseudoustus]|uniref:Carrier domain-containing protein n=1 Tax=Aspergillus pseudoustus TaxID=1810923 RepID=A0ABR4J8N2_9EURO
MLEQANPVDSKINHLVTGMSPALLAATIGAVGDDMDAFWTADPRFRFVVDAVSHSGAESGTSGTILLALKSGELSRANARAGVADHMAGKLCRMLKLDPADVSVDEGSISSYGMDSMIGAELWTWIFNEFDVNVPF